jgi:hypothetical protein
VAIVAEERVGRAVHRIVVRSRRAGLVLAHPDEIAIGAEVEVEEAVTVVVGQCRRRERALQRPLEPERVRVAREAALAVVAE